MFGPSSGLLLKLQGVQGEWRECDEDDIDTFYDDEEPTGTNHVHKFQSTRRQLAMSDETAFSIPQGRKFIFESASIEEILMAKVSSDTGCSICLDTEESELCSLGCGHSFCDDCMSEYLRQKIRSREINCRRKSWLTPRESSCTSARLRVEHIYGVPCPHLGCNELIDVDVIQHLVDQDTFAIYDGHALKQALNKMMLPPCPARCGGYLQEGCVCADPECVKKQFRLKELVQAHINMGKWAQTIGAKCCPNCFSAIEKNMGCDHMYCIQCKTRFLWSQAPLFGTGDHWYKPTELPEEIRKLNLPKAMLSVIQI